MCTVLLPPGDNPIAVNKISYQTEKKITTTPFHSLTERYSMNVDGNFN